MKVFLAGAALPLIYLLGWHGCRAGGMHWPNSWNIPGFLFLAGSYPWSWPAMAYQVELNQLLGQEPRKVIQEAALVVGFGLNVTLSFSALEWVRRITIASRRTR